MDDVSTTALGPASTAQTRVATSTVSGLSSAAARVALDTGMTQGQGAIEPTSAAQQAAVQGADEEQGDEEDDDDDEEDDDEDEEDEDDEDDDKEEDEDDEEDDDDQETRIGVQKRTIQLTQLRDNSTLLVLAVQVDGLDEQSSEIAILSRVSDLSITLTPTYKDKQCAASFAWSINS
jgi:hypothetical protein